MSLCLVRLIEPVFRSINIVFQVFKKKQFLDCFKHLFQKFFNFFSLSLFDLARLHSNFLSFSSLIFARFSSLKASKTILSLLLFLFSCFHAFRGNFRTSFNLEFLLIQCYFFEIDHWVCWYIVLYMIFVG